MPAAVALLLHDTPMGHGRLAGHPSLSHTTLSAARNLYGHYLLNKTRSVRWRASKLSPQVILSRPSHSTGDEARDLGVPVSGPCGRLGRAVTHARTAGSCRGPHSRASTISRSIRESFSSSSSGSASRTSRRGLVAGGEREKPFQAGPVGSRETLLLTRTMRGASGGRRQETTGDV